MSEEVWGAVPKQVTVSYETRVPHRLLHLGEVAIDGEVCPLIDLSITTSGGLISWEFACLPSDPHSMRDQQVNGQSTFDVEIDLRGQQYKGSAVVEGLHDVPWATTQAVRFMGSGPLSPWPNL